MRDGEKGNCQTWGELFYIWKGENTAWTLGHAETTVLKVKKIEIQAAYTEPAALYFSQWEQKGMEKS